MDSFWNLMKALDIVRKVDTHTFVNYYFWEVMDSLSSSITPS